MKYLLDTNIVSKLYDRSAEGHLRIACVGDAGLRRQVEDLLGAHEQASGFGGTAAEFLRELDKRLQDVVLPSGQKSEYDY
jgi:hypothetical protein